MTQKTDNFVKNDFWKPEPLKPSENWIARLLQLSLVISGAGWAVYGVFAFAFDDIRVIPATVQAIMVIIGSALIVIGAEMNSAPTGVAVFRKVGRNKQHWLDYVAFGASLIGSVMSALITFSIRQVLLGETGWRFGALRWGPLVAGLAVALDYYAAVIELGLLKSDYEREMEQWLDEKRQWESGAQQAQSLAVPMPELTARQRAILALYADDGHLTQEEVGQKLTPPRSRTTVRNEVGELVAIGALRKNGDGYVVDGNGHREG